MLRRIGKPGNIGPLILEPILQDIRTNDFLAIAEFISKITICI